MPRESERVVSAQVVLRSASGRRVTEPITSDNVRDAMPSSDAAALAVQTFREAGFEVGSLVANNFSITGSVKTFESVFKTEIRAGMAELQTDALPQRVSSVIDAVVFPPPPDFGPKAP